MIFLIFMEKLFVYGTLRESEIQEKIIGRTIEGSEDTLSGYERSETEIEGETYPILVPNREGRIEGLVLSVNPSELRRIDEYETEAYRRIQVYLQSGERAWVYIKR